MKIKAQTVRFRVASILGVDCSIGLPTDKAIAEAVIAQSPIRGRCASGVILWYARYRGILYDRAMCADVERPASYVYIVRQSFAGFVKVGASADPLRRIEELQTGSPHRLDLVGLVHAVSKQHAFWVEEAIHCRFHGQRMAGEWFRPEVDTELRRAFGHRTEPVPHEPIIAPPDLPEYQRPSPVRHVLRRRMPA